jgi:hypothetical protein
MSIVERIHDAVDLESAKRLFFLMSVTAVLVIPIDGLWVYLGRAKSIRADTTSQDKPSRSLESEETYLTHFDSSALFGNASSDLSASTLQASLAELTKDYRLQGVVLTDVPEAIIQDARTQKTEFIKVGEKLGDLTVKDIKEGFIFLSYLGEEIKLEIK